MHLLRDLLASHPFWTYAELPLDGAPANPHSWDYLAANADYSDNPCGGGTCASILEFFEQKSLCDVMPTGNPDPVRVLVPENSVDPLGIRDNIRYFYFKTTLHDDSVMGEFTWEVAGNQLTVSAVGNIKRLRVRTETSIDDCDSVAPCFTSDLDPTSTVTVVFEGPLDQQLNILVEGYAQAPRAVCRQMNGGLTICFKTPPYNPGSKTVPLRQSSFPGSEAKWTIQP